MKKYLLTIETDNLDFLNKIKLETKSSINKIINYIIRDYQENKDIYVNNNFKLLDNIHQNKNENFREIRIRLSDDEFNLLKETASYNGFRSVSKEAKFRLINSLNKNKFFANAELIAFMKTRTEINSIGKNIYQLLKVLRSNNLVKINEDNLKNTIDSVRDKIDILSDTLGKIIEVNNQRV
ncbi:hypothetical protein LS70_008685 [Helicobacter sp. MIT 11-5569]|jgi:hypothetical protein|uniref:hypothetical protein n=1 Tax=Helicobacter TaxID=209 RepID=UPI00047E919D|nr:MULTISPECIES: hypothetical protein [Helicobacter]TLD80745.1 hypothetical protein LS70_008685 [Helicobacter sp. MIT 11-5569]